jgi:hypothetical protein
MLALLRRATFVAVRKTKRCSKCRRRKRLKFFTLNRSTSSGRNHSCVDCHRQYTRKHYGKNKAYYIAKAARITAVQRAKMRAIVDDIKRKPCKDCGRRFHPVAMDFDHVRGKKIASISAMCRSGWSEKVIRKELAKCEVRCAVCHRLRTHGISPHQRTWRRPYEG